MSLNADRTRLAALTRELWSHWDQTRAVWGDAKRVEFQQRYMDELRASVDNALTHIEVLDKIISKVRSECE
jgi:hypothetical protein